LAIQTTEKTCKQTYSVHLLYFFSDNRLLSIELSYPKFMLYAGIYMVDLSVVFQVLQPLQIHLYLIRYNKTGGGWAPY
jgi:hypothetical protein